MEIPEKIKIGSVNYSGEICYRDLVIRICPCAKGNMEACLVHELMHGIFAHLGYTEHDEKQIDELANALYMVIQDNPEMFAPKE